MKNGGAGEEVGVKEGFRKELVKVGWTLGKKGNG